MAFRAANRLHQVSARVGERAAAPVSAAGTQHDEGVLELNAGAVDAHPPIMAASEIGLENVIVCDNVVAPIVTMPKFGGLLSTVADS